MCEETQKKWAMLREIYSEFCWVKYTSYGSEGVLSRIYGVLSRVYGVLSRVLRSVWCA